MKKVGYKKGLNSGHTRELTQREGGEEGGMPRRLGVSDP